MGDLIWLLVNAQYKDFSRPTFSEFSLSLDKPTDKRSGEQIIDGLIARLKKRRAENEAV